MKLFSWFSRQKPPFSEVKPPETANVVVPQTFSVDTPTREALGRITRRDHCGCLERRTKVGKSGMPDLHVEEQDMSLVGWNKTVALIDSAAAEGNDVLTPSEHIPWEEWMTSITLPKEIGTLKRVKILRLYGSHLRRLPPEIGQMSALKELDVYTSYGLHWLPYEVLRCSNLRSSRMSTRALYGNRRTGLPFPRLREVSASLAPATCSVCNQPFGERAPRPYWTTQRVGTDFVPLLAHTCSDDCTASIPDAPPGYFPRPHKGGGGVGMPVSLR
ncbi:hypothetical protein [Brevundimonas sp. Root1279]|uniref:hypothetical protein n=1 Tax=Brevundimonas sp. Root1279 TaxID=1736443 RepID=UPI0006F8E241|nr:hypothetical protein [Brevundimonas sp. Root1279]KQW79617.1 hypothetical protein ASC65_13745 [Brevundimonas sp. Root1279]